MLRLRSLGQAAKAAWGLKNGLGPIPQESLAVLQVLNLATQVKALASCGVKHDPGKGSFTPTVICTAVTSFASPYLSARCDLKWIIETVLPP